MKKLLTLLCGLLLVSYSYAQKQLDITVGAGYTLIDIEKLVEEDEVSGSSANDWDQFSIGLSAQYFFLETSSFTLGAEAMYQHLYWYEARIPFGSTPFNREYTVTAFRLTPIARFGSEGFAFDVGPTFNINNGFELGVMMSGNYYIAVTDNVDIPIKFRLDAINGSVVPYAPITIHTGVRIRME